MATNLLGQSSPGTEVGRSGWLRSNLGRLARPWREQHSAHAVASGCNSGVLPFCEMGLAKGDGKCDAFEEVCGGVRLREWGSSMRARAGEEHLL